MENGPKNGNSLSLTERLKSLIDNLTEEKKSLLLDLLLEWQQKEQRNDPRIPCLVAVDYYDQRKIYRDFIQDLSRGGVFIETKESFDQGQKISLTFTLPSSQNHFKTAGEIVRTSPKGIGIQFSNKLSKYQEEIIRKAIDPKGNFP